MKRIAGMLIILGIVSLFTNVVYAAILFEDNFNTENAGTPTLNYYGFINWDVTDGSVDLIGNGFYDFYPDEGLYIDLDGSTNNAGRLESKITFALNPGTYELQFDLAGHSSRGPNTVTVTLGDVYDESFTLSQTDTYLSTFVRTIDVMALTSGKLVFDHSGGDNQGITLDNVRLTVVPIPGAVWLLGCGLVGIVGMRRKKQKLTFMEI